MTIDWKINIMSMETRIVRESDYSPAAVLFMQEKCQVLI